MTGMDRVNKRRKFPKDASISYSYIKMQCKCGEAERFGSDKSKEREQSAQRVLGIQGDTCLPNTSRGCEQYIFRATLGSLRSVNHLVGSGGR